MTSRPLAQAFDEAFQRCRDMDASLSDRLDSLANAVRTLSPPFADAVDRLVTRLQQSGAGETAPQVGEPMPPFHLPDESGRIVSLEELLTNGPVAVTFHRGHWCPYCRLNTSALVLLCHKFRYRFRAAQHGQRDSIVARAATNLLRIVAIEFGTWRSGRNGGSSGLVTFAYGNLRAQRGGTIS